MSYLFNSIILLFIILCPITRVEAGVKKIAVFDFEDAAAASQAQKGKYYDKTRGYKVERG